jgi:hypothetical protein
MTEWYSVDSLPLLSKLDWDNEVLESEKVLIVGQTGEYYIGYYHWKQWVEEPAGKWYESGRDCYSLETTGPFRIRYWRYLKKDHPPLS